MRIIIIITIIMTLMSMILMGWANANNTVQAWLLVKFFNDHPVPPPPFLCTDHYYIQLPLRNSSGINLDQVQVTNRRSAQSRNWSTVQLLLLLPPPCQLRPVGTHTHTQAV